MAFTWPKDRIWDRLHGRYRRRRSFVLQLVRRPLPPHRHCDGDTGVWWWCDDHACNGLRKYKPMQRPRGSQHGVSFWELVHEHRFRGMPWLPRFRTVDWGFDPAAWWSDPQAHGQVTISSKHPGPTGKTRTVHAIMRDMRMTLDRIGAPSGHLQRPKRLAGEDRGSYPRKAIQQALNQGLPIAFGIDLETALKSPSAPALAKPAPDPPPHTQQAYGRSLAGALMRHKLVMQAMQRDQDRLAALMLNRTFSATDVSLEDDIQVAADGTVTITADRNVHVPSRTRIHGGRGRGHAMFIMDDPTDPIDQAQDGPAHPVYPIDHLNPNHHHQPHPPSPHIPQNQTDLPLHHLHPLLQDIHHPTPQPPLPKPHQPHPPYPRRSQPLRPSPLRTPRRTR